MPLRPKLPSVYRVAVSQSLNCLNSEHPQGQRKGLQQPGITRVFSTVENSTDEEKEACSWHLGPESRLKDKRPPGTSLPNNKVQIFNSVIPTAVNHNFSCWHFTCFKTRPQLEFSTCSPTPLCFSHIALLLHQTFLFPPSLPRTVCSFRSPPPKSK